MSVVIVSRTEMQQTMGDHSPKTLAKSEFFGMISSPCSYASTASGDESATEQAPITERFRSRKGWGDASGYTISDLTMLRMPAVMWATMSVGGLAVEYLFKAVQTPTPGRPSLVVHTGFEWNYTTVLNIIALAGFAVIYWLYRHRDTTGGRFAKNPVCAIQVEIAHAPAQRSTLGNEGQSRTVYFCSDHCAAGYNERRTPSASTSSTTAGPGGHRHGETR